MFFPTRDEPGYFGADAIHFHQRPLGRTQNRRRIAELIQQPPHPHRAHLRQKIKRQQRLAWIHKIDFNNKFPEQQGKFVIGETESSRKKSYVHVHFCVAFPMVLGDVF